MVTARGRVVRLVAGGLLVLGLVAGSLFGDDKHFPFGPMRMFSTTDRLDQPVKSLRVEAVDVTGRRFVLTQGRSGMRRAEVEGQVGRMRRDPSLVGALATAYHRRRPRAPRLTEIDIIVRDIALHGGKPTGRYTDDTILTWFATGTAP
jgi:hypothetical protein